jgi:nucleoside-diphosphate-sugar epimerase
MKILLTGDEGYIGSGLSRYLKQTHEVVGWNSKKDVRTLNPFILKELNIKAVVNCATVTDRATSLFKVDSPTDLVNVGGARTLVKALKDSKIPLIHISTKDVFGKFYILGNLIEEEQAYLPKFRINDDQPFRPESIYAKSKLMAEFILEDHPETVIVRLSSCYTDFDHDKGSWIVKVAKKIQAGEPVTVSHNGKQFRDLLHSDDLGNLIEIILKSNCFGVKVNAGGGKENTHSVREVIHMYSPEARILESDDDGDYGFVFSNKRVEEIFNWHPKIRFTSQVPTILENIRNSKKAI